ncbi:MAG: hypothetical protein OEX12_05865 [Gammaproteobacteria bacterium]|nr:hypothetical protein [Gammaproteobacteria bacterium]
MRAKVKRMKNQYIKKPNPAGTKMKNLARKGLLGIANKGGIVGEYFRNLRTAKNLEKLRA